MAARRLHRPRRLPGGPGTAPTGRRLRPAHPERYSTVGAVGQRLFEAVLAGCLPIGPATIRGIHRNIPRALVAEDGAQVASLVGILTSASPRTRSKLLTECLRRLDPFRVTAQTTIVNALLKSP